MSIQITVKKPTKEEIAETESWNIWEKEASSFHWLYKNTETCYILKGSATITLKNGDQVEIKKGDYVIFPMGLECRWSIKEDMEKRYKFG